ncbi:MAG: ankyrin repeat domain-containing protein [Myxococcota bacterium]
MTPPFPQWLVLLILAIEIAAPQASADPSDAPEPPLEPATEARVDVPAEQDPALENAKRALRRRDFEDAVRIWRTSADRGSSRAQYRLGSAYRVGLGVEKDLPLAITWLERSAEGGEAEAQYDLGVLYQSGSGIRPNREKALEWLGRAARGGHKNAAKRLAEIRSTNAFTLSSARVGTHRDAPTHALNQAIRVGDLDSAREALARGALDDPTEQAAVDRTPLLLAVEMRREEIVGLLLKQGASPNPASPLGESALLLAIRGGQNGIVRRLLEAGAGPESPSPSGTRPLMEAARNGDTTTVALLLEHGARADAKLPDGTSARDLARRFGHTQVAQTLRAAGSSSRLDSDKNRASAPASLAHRGRDGGLPAVIEAARRGDVGRLRTLAEAGANLQIVDPDGDTALHRAAESGSLEAVLFLISGGAAPNTPGRAGSTPLMRAIASSAKGVESVMEALLAAGADAERLDKNGAGLVQYAALAATETKLALLPEKSKTGPIAAAAFAQSMEKAAAAGETDSLKALTAHAPPKTDRGPSLCGALSANQPDSVDLILSLTQFRTGPCPDGSDALMLASRLGRKAFVKRLLAANFSPRMRPSETDSPLIAAASRGHSEIVHSLLAAGADPNHRGAQRMTALQTAAANGQLEVARILLQSGADPRLRNASNSRAADLARDAGHSKIVELIESSTKKWGSW